MRPLRLAIATLALLLAAAPAARAAYEPVGAGATRLNLDGAFLRLMKQNGVKVTAVAPASLRGRTVTFPASGGKFDPTSGSGTVEHDGALRLSSAAGSIPLKDLQLKTTQRRSPFSAKVGGGQLKVGAVTGLETARAGFGEKVAATGLTLSGKLATRLAKKLKLRGVIEEGLALGSVVTTVDPTTVTLLGKGSVSLDLAPSFLAKLGSLFVSVNPIFPAEHPGAFTLSIAGGDLAPDGASGKLETEGALEFLQLGGGQVFWANGALDFDAHGFAPELDVEPSPPYAGKTGRATVGAFSPPSGPLSADAKRRTIAAAGIGLAMDAATAASFNEVFAKPQARTDVFTAGEAIGTLSFSAQGQ